MKVEDCKHSDDELINPASNVWEGVASEKVSMAPIPLKEQPNEYIKTSWKGKSYGNTKEAVAAALGKGDQLYVRLQWADEATSASEFADAAAILTGKGKSVKTMGSDKEPMNLWYWAEDRDKGVSATSTGPGVFKRNGNKSITAAANRDKGTLSVVIAGPAAEIVDNKIGVAIWDGSNDERAGLAAISGWVSLDKG